MPATCPRCKRNVVASRPTCLYCGARLVEETAAGASDDEVKRRMQKASADPAELVAQGNADLRAGRTEKALLIYRQVLSIRPDHAPALSNTAAAFLRMGRHEESVVCATEALLANPGLAPAFANLALAWLGLGKSEAALEAWMRAQELDPRLGAPPLVALSKAFAEANAIYRAAIAALAAAKLVRARSLFMELVSRKLARAAERSDAGKRLEAIAGELARWDAAAWLSQARLMRKDGQAELAVGCFDEVLRLEPDQPEALMQKGQAAFQLGETALAANGGARDASTERWLGQALECLRKVVKRNPNDAGAWKLLGMSAFMMGRGLEAEEAMARARSLGAPGQATLSVQITGVAEGAEGGRAWLATATELAQRGETEEANRAYAKALELDPTMVEAWLERGVGLAMLGQGEEALGCFDRAVALAPRNQRVHDYRGVCLTRLGRAEEALESFDRALELTPGDGSVIKHKGGALRALERWEEAASLFRRALQANPELTECHALLADAQEMMGQGEQAVISFERFLERSGNTISPQVTEAKQRLAALRAQKPAGAAEGARAQSKLAEAEALKAQGKLEAALHCLDEAARLDPAGPEAPFHQGNILLQLGRIAEAGQSFQEAVRRNPRLAAAWCNLGYCQMRVGQLDGALQCLDRAVALDPRDAEAWINRSNALCELGRIVEGLESADRALAIDPKASGAWGNRGRALGTMGRIDEALRAFEKGCELAPDNAMQWANRAMALAKLGRLKEALACVQRALHIDPDHDLGNQLLAAIRAQLE